MGSGEVIGCRESKQYCFFWWKWAACNVVIVRSQVKCANFASDLRFERNWRSPSHLKSLFFPWKKMGLRVSLYDLTLSFLKCYRLCIGSALWAKLWELWALFWPDNVWSWSQFMISVVLFVSFGFSLWSQRSQWSCLKSNAAEHRLCLGSAELWEPLVRSRRVSHSPAPP